jgi:hypothetical protein
VRHFLCVGIRPLVVTNGVAVAVGDHMREISSLLVIG